MQIRTICIFNNIILSILLQQLVSFKTRGARSFRYAFSRLDLQSYCTTSTFVSQICLSLTDAVKHSSDYDGGFSCTWCHIQLNIEQVLCIYWSRAFICSKYMPYITIVYKEMGFPRGLVVARSFRQSGRMVVVPLDHRRFFSERNETKKFVTVWNLISQSLIFKLSKSRENKEKHNHFWAEFCSRSVT